MIEKLKWYAVEVILPKYVPAAIIALVGYVVTFLLSHASFLEPYGITTGQWPLQMEPPSGMVTLVEWATLGTKLGAVLAAFAGVAIAAFVHHTTGTSTEKPGGQRASDPPSH